MTDVREEMKLEDHQIIYNLEEIIEQLKDLDTNGMIAFYVKRAIEQLEIAKEEVDLTQDKQEQSRATKGKSLEPPDKSH